MIETFYYIMHIFFNIAIVVFVYAAGLFVYRKVKLCFKTGQKLKK